MTHTLHIRKFAFAMLLMLSFAGFSQNVPINFETGGNGATWTWTTFENGATSAPMQIISNPVSGGVNTSATVAKLTPLVVGQPWAGVESSHGAGIGTWTISASNSTIKIMVYKSVISDVGIKLVTSTGGSTGEIKKPNTVINQWEEITFDFTSKIGETNDQIVVFPDFQARTTDNVCYWDNITFSGATPPPAPTAAAPTPTKPAADVKSMFSNAYTNVTVDTWRTSWSSATLTDLQIVGNDTKKYSSLDFVGIETVGPNLINASSMLYFHVDAWTANMTTFRIKLVDFGADAAYGGGDDKEHELTFTPTLNSWNGFEIPLSDFTGLTTKGHIAQLIFSGAPAGSGIIYLDNIYFHKVPFVDPNIPTVAAPTPTWPATDVISMFSNAYTNKTVDTWRTSWSAATLTDLQIAGNDTKKYSALDFVGIETAGANQINATPMKWLHLDAWTPNMTTFKVKLVDFGADGAFGGGDDKEHELTLTPPTLKSWNSYDLLLSDFTGLTTRAHLAQYILVGVPTGTSTVYVDNVYFRKTSIGINKSNVSTTHIYPNPATNTLKIESAQNVENVTISNVMGQEVISMEPNTMNVSLDIANLSNGIYIVKTIIGGVTTTSKITKQ